MSVDATGEADPTSRVSVTPVVLAGGESRRFGSRWKAIATFRGDPLIARVTAAVRRVADRSPIVAVGSDDKRAVVAPALGDDVRYTTDATWCAGPLAGLAGAVASVTTDAVVCCGCDMPLVSARAVEWLTRELAEHDADAVVPRVDGKRQPLHAAYDRTALRADLDDEPSDDRLSDLLNRLDTRTVAPTDAPPAVSLARSVTNVNTPAALRSLTVSGT